MPAARAGREGLRPARRRSRVAQSRDRSSDDAVSRRRSRHMASRAAAQWVRGRHDRAARPRPDAARDRDEGPDAFYTGWIADSIAADMARARRPDHEAATSPRTRRRMRTPVRGTYRGYDLITMPPPTRGGVTMVEMLNILEQFDLAKLGDMSPDDAAPRDRGDAPRLSRSRALPRRSGLREDADRAAHVARRTRSRSRRRSIRRHASSSVELGKDIVTPIGVARKSDETTHFSIVDRDGNAVSNTFTLEGGYGSHVVVAGAGFLLNNEMGDFNKKPGETNLTGDIGTTANLIAPGKRMLSSMSADDRHEERQAVHGHRLAGRAHDHQHGDGDRARRHRLRAGRAAGRGRAAVPPSVAAGHGDLREERHSRLGGCPAAGHGARGQVQPRACRATAIP